MISAARDFKIEILSEMKSISTRESEDSRNVCA